MGGPRTNHPIFKYTAVGGEEESEKRREPKGWIELDNQRQTAQNFDA